jgi:hypothetical protein
VGGGGQASAPWGPSLADFCGTQKSADRTDGVAQHQLRVGRLLQERRYFFVRADGCLGEMAGL